MLRKPVVCTLPSMLDRFFFGKHLEDDEKVARIVHTYWGAATNAFFWPIASLIVGFAALIIAPVPVVFFLDGLWMLFCLSWIARSFFDYYLDVWIITDQGIIDLKWNGWFQRQSSRILYSDIQGVSYEISGIFGTINRTGKVTVEKMSTGTSFSMSHIRNPRVVEGLILRKMEDYLHKKNLKDATHVQDLLASFVAEKVQLSDLKKKEPKDQAPKRTIVSRRV